MKKRTLLAGSLFGLLAPFIGLFIGLQVSVALGNLLLLPIIGLSALLDTPFGMFSGIERLVALLSSVVFWALVFLLINKIWQKIKSKPKSTN